MSKVIYLSYEASEGLLKSIGLEVVTLKRKSEFKNVIRQLKQADVSVVFVSEAVFRDYEVNINQLNKTFELAVSVLPNKMGHDQLAQMRLKKFTQEVLGVNAD